MESKAEQVVDTKVLGGDATVVAVKGERTGKESRVMTKMGPGVVVEVRGDDGVKVVELDWRLANDSKVYVYTKDETPRVLTFLDYMSELWPAYMCGFVDFLGLAIAIPILPYYILELSWDGSECPQCPNPDPNYDLCGKIPECGTAVDLGALTGCFSIGQFVGNIIMGRVSDRVGRKFVILASLFMSGLGYLLCGVASDLYQLYLFRCLSGLAGGTMPVIISIVLDTVQDVPERAKFFGLAGASIGFAFMFGPAIGAGVAAALGKRAGFFAPAVIALVTLICAFYKIIETHPTAGILGKRPKWLDEKFGKPEGKKKTTAVKAGGAEESLPTVVYWTFLGNSFGSMAFATFNSMVALVFLYLYNWGATEIGMFLFTNGVINIFWAVQSRKILEKLSVPGIKGLEYIRGIVFSVILTGAYLGAYSYITNGVMQFVFMALVLPLGMAIKQPTYSQIVGVTVPLQFRGRANGIISSANSVGNGLVPFVAGPLFLSDVFKQKYEYGEFSHLIYVIAVVLCALEGLNAWFILRPAVLRAAAKSRDSDVEVSNKGVGEQTVELTVVAE